MIAKRWFTVYVYLIDVSFKTGQHRINAVRNPVKCQSRSFPFKWSSGKCIRPASPSRSSEARCTVSTYPAVWTSAAASQSHSVGSFPRTLSKLFIVSKEHVLCRAGDNVIVYPQFLTCEYRVFKRGYQHSHTRVSQILYAAWRVLSYGIHHIMEDQHNTFILMNFDICLSSSPGTWLPSVPPPEASCLRTSCTPECLDLYFLLSIILHASMLCV